MFSTLQVSNMWGSKSKPVLFERPMLRKVVPTRTTRNLWVDVLNLPFGDWKIQSSKNQWDWNHSRSRHYPYSYLSLPCFPENGLRPQATFFIFNLCIITIKRSPVIVVHFPSFYYPRSVLQYIEELIILVPTPYEITAGQVHQESDWNPGGGERKVSAWWLWVHDWRRYESGQLFRVPQKTITSKLNHCQVLS